jgi:flagellar FliL protein
MANRLEAKPEEGARNGHDKAETAAPAAGGGGMKSWLPLILNIILMPAVAFGVTKFVLLPKLGAAAPHAAAGTGHAAEGAAKPEPSAKSSKVTVPLSGKVLVNVAGTMGTRYLVTSLTLVGTSPELKNKVEENDAQLRDAASAILAAKTIGDLEKPGMRNIIRTELMSAFNDVLGRDAVTEIYLTEFAIQ